MSWASRINSKSRTCTVQYVWDRSLHPLTFLTWYDEEDTTAYLQTFVRILNTECEYREQEDAQLGWRYPSTVSPPTQRCVSAKAGHTQKLVNKGILEKTYASNRYTHYRLNLPTNELADDVGAASRYLDQEHRELLDGFPV